ncbi:hypothetical protein [Blastococcus brunescens]|uniref:Bacterial bifunctional deaminase-reductase C-terminal domain-containing protein n=1 Tax=Blastococcus brunescens TaxID=1564165 RepID=A0ABZ1B1E2_9ACTN|nr:hypothetical protein [Blastococcus sp. BMG 8361]WRL63154.1 hypothetical protein U6N30_25655 [Blastococcus sp. BMG 8361]
MIAEPSSGVWGGAGLRGGALLLGAPEWLDAHRPDRVVVVGRPTLSRPVSALLADPRVQVETTTAGPRWPDAVRSSSAVGLGFDGGPGRAGPSTARGPGSGPSPLIGWAPPSTPPSTPRRP